MQVSKITTLLTMLILSIALLATGCTKADTPADVPTEENTQALEEGEAADDAEAKAAVAGDGKTGAADCGCDHADGHCDGAECGCDHADGECDGAECGCDKADGECGCGGADHAGHGHGDSDHAGHDHGDHAGDAHGDDIMDLVLKAGTYDESKVVRQPDAKIGDLTRCTVSGEAFVVTDAHPHVTFEGKEVYFCCPGCIRRFQRNPQSYIDGQK